MTNIFVTGAPNGTICVNYNDSMLVSRLRKDISERKGLASDDYYILHQGKLVDDSDLLEDGTIYHLQPRLCGGKGGFGSMLRAIGAQIEKTTSREACRDLSGRRMRDVNNEKKLREWVAKQADREREKEQRRQERLERRRAEPRHNFDDPQYHQQKQQVFEGLEDALQTGLQKAGTSGTSSSATGSRKRKVQTETASKSKMAREWLGVEGLSDLSSDSDEDENSSTSHCESSSASPCPPTLTENSGSDGSGIISVNKGKSRLVQEDANEEQFAEDKEHSSIDNSDSNSSHSQNEKNADSATSLCSKKENGLLTALSAVPPVQQLQNSENANTLNSTTVTTVNPEKAGENSQQIMEEEQFDLSKYSSAEELLVLGGDQLKAELMALGLKCGGAPAERAQRLFSVKGLSRDQIDPKLFAKPTKGKKK